MNVHKLLYGFYGIYVDWTIDHNLFYLPKGQPDYNGITSYDSFINCDCWEIHTITISGKDYLLFDIALPYYSFHDYTKLKTTCIKSGIKGDALLQSLEDIGHDVHLDILDPMVFYLTGGKRVETVSAEQVASADMYFESTKVVRHYDLYLKKRSALTSS